MYITSGLHRSEMARLKPQKKILKRIQKRRRYEYILICVKIVDFKISTDIFQGQDVFP